MATDIAARGIDVDGVSFGAIDVGGLVMKQAAADAEAVARALRDAVRVEGAAVPSTKGTL